MKKNYFCLIIVFMTIFCLNLFSRQVYVKPYYRKDGTYVRGHYRNYPGYGRTSNPGFKPMHVKSLDNTNYMRIYMSGVPVVSSSYSIYDSINQSYYQRLANEYNYTNFYIPAKSKTKEEIIKEKEKKLLTMFFNYRDTLYKIVNNKGFKDFVKFNEWYNPVERKILIWDNEQKVFSVYSNVFRSSYSGKFNPASEWIFEEFFFNNRLSDMLEKLDEFVLENPNLNTNLTALYNQYCK